MVERIFLFVVGALILASLYIETELMIYLLCLWLAFEGITNLRITTMCQRLFKKAVPSGMTVFQSHERFTFDAFRAWRITVAIMLGGSMLLLYERNIQVVWFIPWFMGFAMLGAGVSGVCPGLLLFRWIGFK